jgi:hypothetical protein
MASGGLFALLWGAWLLVAMVLLAGGNPPGTALRLGARSMGAAGELAWLGSNACWLAALARLCRRGLLARPMLLLPAAGAASYLAASLLIHGLLPGWPLRVPPTALGTALWSLGMCALALAHWRGRARLLSLAIGLFYALVPLPGMVLLGHPPVYLLGLGWGLLWIALGWSVGSRPRP